MVGIRLHKLLVCLGASGKGVGGSEGRGVTVRLLSHPQSTQNMPYATNINPLHLCGVHQVVMTR